MHQRSTVQIPLAASLNKFLKDIEKRMKCWELPIFNRINSWAHIWTYPSTNFPKIVVCWTDQDLRPRLDPFKKKMLLELAFAKFFLWPHPSLYLRLGSIGNRISKYLGSFRRPCSEWPKLKNSGIGHSDTFQKNLEYHLYFSFNFRFIGRCFSSRLTSSCWIYLQMCSVKIFKHSFNSQHSLRRSENQNLW